MPSVKVVRAKDRDFERLRMLVLDLMLLRVNLFVFFQILRSLEGFTTNFTVMRLERSMDT